VIVRADDSRPPAERVVTTDGPTAERASLTCPGRLKALADAERLEHLTTAHQTVACPITTTTAAAGASTTSPPARRCSPW